MGRRGESADVPENSIHIARRATTRKKEQFHMKNKVKSFGAAEGRTRIAEFVALSANHWTILACLE